MTNRQPSIANRQPPRVKGEDGVAREEGQEKRGETGQGNGEGVDSIARQGKREIKGRRETRQGEHREKSQERLRERQDKESIKKVVRGKPSDARKPSQCSRDEATEPRER